VKVLGIFTRDVGGVPLWTYIAGVLAVGLLLGGGLFVGKRRMRKIEEVPSYTWLDSLMTAIKRDVVRGVPEPDIRRALLDIGWPMHIVNQSIREINKAMLGTPVEKDIALGYDETKLKGALMGKGWPESTVDSVIDDVNLSILRKTMEYNFAKGYSSKKIGKGMVAVGWPQEMVSKVVEEFKSLK
jgi:hypothetical protein